MDKELNGMKRTAEGQRADAWLAVADLLDVLVPDWFLAGNTGQESALQTIRGLVQKSSGDGKQLAIDAMELALNSHGRMLLTHPPKDAWDYNGVSGKLHNAISTLEREI